MADNSDGQRHSVPLSADLISDEVERAELESKNALNQFDAGIELIRSFIDTSRPFKLRPSQILGLHRAALEGLSAYAGNFRPAGIEIKGSKHQPAGAHLVAEQIEDLCEYVNEFWKTATPIHLAAYVMWRLNWIHPFADGNGRTSRIISYVDLCISLGYLLLGTNSIPDQITADRTPYFDALEAADAAAKQSETDLTEMKNLLSKLLAVQLVSVIEDAGGNLGPDKN